MRRSVLAVAAAAAVGLSVATSSTTVFAQDKDQDAERLFREGQKLMEERNFGGACPKFEAAYKKDQQLGTLLNLAYCHKEQGAIWQSWLEFKEAEMKAIELKRSDRKEFARQKMVELEKDKSIARVMIEPTTKVELTEINVEDRRIPEAERGVPFAAEPGQRKVTFRAKGKKDKSAYITIVRADKPQKISVPEMETETAGSTPPVEPPPKVDDPPKTTPQPPPPADEKSDGSTQRMMGIVVAGVGVVGIGVGSYFGLKTLNSPCRGTIEELKERCPSGAEGQRLHDEAQSTGVISNIAFSIGGAALVGGALLYFLAPSGKSASSSSSTVGTGVARANEKRAHSGLQTKPQIGLGWIGLNGSF